MEAAAEYLFITIALALIVISCLILALLCVDRIKMKYEQWRRQYLPKNRFRKERKR